MRHPARCVLDSRRQRTRYLLTGRRAVTTPRDALWSPSTSPWGTARPVLRAQGWERIKRAGIKVGFRVIDSPHALHEVENYEQELHIAVQLALRTAVGEATVDDLLERRLGLGGRLAALVSERAPTLGLEVFGIDLRDVMLPGDLKGAFADVLRARAEGRAALERARGESAALRNLANAARLMDANPALMNLRLLQTIGQDAGVPGTTRFVVHLPEGATGSGTAEAGGPSPRTRR